MTMTPFTCHDFAEHLADCMEHDAAAAVVAAMDAHAVGCAECRALRTDLDAIRSGAAMLPGLSPSRDLWAGIAERIEAPVVPLAAAHRTWGRQGAAAVPRRGNGPAATGRRWWAHPAVAAAALVGITAGVTYTVTREAMQRATPATTVAAATPAPAGPTTAEPSNEVTAGGAAAGGAADREERTPRVEVASADAASAGAASVAAGVRRGSPRNEVPIATMAAYRPGDLAALDSLYFREIVRLRQVLEERRGQLDSTTVAVLDRNMLVIDRAIQECRKALAADPASSFLNEQLNEALETKIELLRTAATMAVGE